MSWNDEIVKRQADRYVCLEIELDGGMLRLCDRPLLDDDCFWRPAILAMTSLVRQLDPETRRVSFQDLTITMRNDADPQTGIGYFSTLIEDETVFDGRVATVWLVFREESGALFREVIFAGLCQPGELGETTFTLTLHVPLEDRLKLLQRHATDTAFDANVPAPVPMNVVLGACTGAARGGAVKCIPLDLTSATKCFLVAQHAVRSIDTVYRLRAGAWTELTSGLTKYTAVPDAEGHRCARIAISSGHADGDEYYAACTGLMTGGCLNLDGASVYAWHADHADFDITGDMTLEIMFRWNAAGTARRIFGKFDEGSTLSWQIELRADGTLWFYLSGDGSTAASIRTIGTIPTGVWTRLKIVYDASAVEVSIWRDGLLCARAGNSTQSGCTLNNTITGAIFAGNSTLKLGAGYLGGATGRFFNGTIAFAGIWATESDDGTSLLAGDSSCKGFWALGGDLSDSSGKGHTLTGVNIAASDYGTTWENPHKHVLCANPADSLRELLLCPDGWDLAAAELDMSSFDAAAPWCAAQGYAAAGAWGGIIPEEPGRLESEGQQWDLLALIARNFDHAVVPNRAGQIALKRIPMALTDATGLVHYRQEYGDVIGSMLVIRHRPLDIVNDARGLYKHAHSAAAHYDRYLRAYNAASQSYFGLKKEAQWPYRFHRTIPALQGVLGPQVHLRSGRTREVSMTTPGLWGLQPGSDIGDVVLLSAAGVFGNFHERQILVTGASADLLAGTVTLTGLTLGDSLGAVAFSTEETAELVAERSTFIGATQNPIQGESFIEAAANSSFGDRAWLRHGHHYSIYYSVGTGYGNVNWRALLRWRLPAADWNNRTVRAVTIQLQVLEIPSLLYDIFWETYRSGWSGAALWLHDRSSCTDPAWDEYSTYNGIWNPPDIGSRLGPSFAGGAGSRSVVLESDGIAAFAAAAGGTGQGTLQDEVNICLAEQGSGDYTNSCLFASTRHSTVAWRPRAIITYLVS